MTPIGQGSYGTVYKTIDKSSKQIVALKKISKVHIKFTFLKNQPANTLPVICFLKL